MRKLTHDFNTPDILGMFFFTTKLFSGSQKEKSHRPAEHKLICTKNKRERLLVQVFRRECSLKSPFYTQ